MRSSSLALFGAAGALFISVAGAGCRIEAHTQTQFNDTSQPPLTASKDWAGEKITIQNDGINPAVGTTGIEVKFDANAKRITAVATFSASADDDKQSDAQSSIHDAVGTFKIDESNGFTISCNHGGSHGSSGVAASGCKLMTVTVPAGSATQPLDITVGNGNGDIRIAVDGGAVPTVKNLIVQNKGSGSVDVHARHVPAAVIVVTGGDEVAVSLPTNFSAGKVLFTTNDSDPAAAAARVHVPGFTGMVTGSPFPVAGATADAAASLNVQSTGILDLDTVTINAFQ